MPAPNARRAPRSDAVRNRAALVATAAEAFREDGLAVSVNEIARRAGVNVATLYRHFPTKDHLVDAVLAAVLEPLSAARDEALGASDRDQVLATFLRRAASLQGEHRGLVDAMAGGTTSLDVRGRLRGPATEIVAAIVERGHESGELRADYGAQDLLIVLRMLGTVTGLAPHAGIDVDRYVDFALRGLR